MRSVLRNVKRLTLKENNRVTGVIFDLDGTLVDSLGVLTQAFNQGIQIFGLGLITRERLAVFLNQAISPEDMLLEIFPHTFGDRKARQRCMEEAKRAYVKLEKDMPLFPDTLEVLSFLKVKGLKVGIATARVFDIECDLHRLGIAQFIDAVVTGVEVQYRKPAPDGIIECLERLGLSAGESIFVGDSRADIIAGKRAGVSVIAVSTGVADREALIAEEPVIIIDDLTQLVKIIW